MEDVNNLLKKYFTSYTEGKKIYSKDNDKAFEYFKESLIILDTLKKNYSHKIKKYENILDESEISCHKYINMTLESSINSENNDKKKISIIDLYNELEKGNLELIKSAKINQINFNEYFENDTILHWAIKFGDTTFLKYAFKLGASIDTTNKNGYTLLEYACLLEDPNIINFLADHGANMQKHLFFRAGDLKYINKNNSIDISILIKIILSYVIDSGYSLSQLQLIDNNNFNNKIYNKLKIIENFFDINEKINLNDYTFKDLLVGLMFFLNKLSEESALTYLTIINEELSYTLHNKLGCPKNKLDIILVHIVPFIDYPFMLSINWIISLELKYLIINLIKKKKFNSLNIKKEILDKIWNIYIKNNIIQEDYLGCLISQWITKIKV